MKKNYKTNIIAQYLLNNILNSEGDYIKTSIRYRIFLMLRDLLLKKMDPFVKYQLQKFEIILPLSHNFPIYKKIYPDYVKNIVKVVEVLSEKNKNLKIIDVGGNIGDTVLSIKNYFDVPILSIEPDKTFYGLLCVNTKQFIDVQNEKFYLGELNKQANFDLKNERGTAYIDMKNKTMGKKEIYTLDKILKSFKTFQKSELLKIDTDGYDYRILKGAKQYLKKIRPVIFFEYWPEKLNQYSKNGSMNLFKYLVNIGYLKCLIFDNYGRYMLSIDIDKRGVLKDVSKYALNNWPHNCYDICVFSNNHNDIYKKLLKHYRG